VIVSFPHMGDLNIALKALFTGLGQQVLPPPPVSKRTLEIGVRYSPEAVCLPFKIALGNFIEALEQGADTLVTCGGAGPCRLGYYAEIQRGILQNLGYQFKMIVFEPAIGNFFASLRQIAPKQSFWEIGAAFRLALTKLNALDAIQRQTYRIRPREINAGEADAAREAAAAAIDAANTLPELKAARDKAERRLAGVKLRPGANPLRVGVIGEIYVMLEPFANFDLDRRLGRMGVEVHKTMLLSDYVNGHLFRKREYLSLFSRLAELARPYLGHYVGGHGLKSIAHTVKMSREDCDGMIHVFPFSCMPEVIARNILPKVSKDTGIPVLSLAFDEQSGEAGVVTRLEAFLDVLRQRRAFFCLQEGNNLGESEFPAKQNTIQH